MKNYLQIAQPNRFILVGAEQLLICFLQWFDPRKVLIIVDLNEAGLSGRRRRLLDGEQGGHETRVGGVTDNREAAPLEQRLPFCARMVQAEVAATVANRRDL